MALIGIGTPFLPMGMSTGWLLHSAAGDLTPASVTNLPQDLVRGIGRQPGSGDAIGRTLINQLCPVGTAVIQSVPGTDKASFTTRAPMQGTLVNSMTIGDGAQVAGTFPASALSLVGRTIRVTGGGTWGATGTPNFTVDVALGANILATSGVFAVSAVTMQSFDFEFISQVMTAGSSGVVNTAGSLVFHLTTATSITSQMTNSTPGTGLSIDLTATQALTVNATCSASDPANRIRLWELVVEVLY